MTLTLARRRQRRLAPSSLAAVPGAPACPTDVRDALAHHTDVLEPRAGAVLAREGATAHEVVVIVEGEVLLERGGRPAGCLRAGASFGGHEVLTGTPHRYTVVARGGVEVRVVEAPAFLAAAERLPLLRAPLRPAC
jgi:CRP-like cAMP-binding protein